MTSPGTRPASQRLVTEETVDDHITRVGNATYAPVDEVPEFYRNYIQENAGGGGEAYPPVVYSVIDGQRVLPELVIALFGDSLTNAGVNPWSAILESLTGWPVVNRGISGQGAADILLRQGGLQPRLTLAAGEIPADLTPVSVTAVDPADGWRTGGSGSFGFGGYLAGVRGTLTHNLVDGSWSFTRTTAGTVTPVPAGTPFVGVETARNPTAHQIIWVGRNNAGSLPVVRDLIGLALERGIETQVKRYLIIGVTNGTNEGKAHATYAKIVEHNRLLKARYGKFFYDIRRDLIDRGLQIAGITPTSQDLADIADDRIPGSLMADTLHPNAAGYGVVGQLIAEKVLELGWVESLTGGTPAPTEAPTLTAGSSASTSQQLSWTAVSGATSYKVEYRQQGASAWSTGPSVTGTSATVNGLTVATTYEYRVAAANSGGTGPWSATVSKATAAGVTVLTSDSFNRADTTAGNLGTTDAAYGGTAMVWDTDSQLQILSNQVGGAVNNTRFARVELGAADHYVETVIAATTEGGVVARWTDPNNWYSVRSLASGQVYLEVRQSGSTVTLEQSAAGALVVGDRLGLLVQGSTIAAYLNGVQLLSREDTRLTTGTKAGIRSAFSNTAFRLDTFRAATGVLTTPAA